MLTSRRAFLLGASSMVAAASMPKVAVKEVTYASRFIGWELKNADEIMMDLRELICQVSYDAKTGWYTLCVDQMEAAHG